jgi:hypothetical protein
MSATSHRRVEREQKADALYEKIADDEIVIAAIKKQFNIEDMTRLQFRTDLAFIDQFVTDLDYETAAIDLVTDRAATDPRIAELLKADYNLDTIDDIRTHAEFDDIVDAVLALPEVNEAGDTAQEASDGDDATDAADALEPAGVEVVQAQGGADVVTTKDAADGEAGERPVDLETMGADGLRAFAAAHDITLSVHPATKAETLRDQIKAAVAAKEASDGE